MRLENISLRLRPRATYEATDLGVRLVQRNAGPVYRAWFAIVVPLMLLLLPLQTIAPWLPAVLIWWLKPLYDRLVLFVLSRSVFGEPTSVADVTAAWRIWCGSGIVGSLTWRRLEFTRAFSLPIYLLERLPGKPRRARAKVLQRNTRSVAVLTQVAYLHIDAAINFSLIALVFLLLPAHANIPMWSWMIGQEVPLAWTVMTGLVYIAALTLIEPLYVAAGFALYLNRRIELEAWDIEVSLRRAADAAASGRRQSLVEGSAA